MVQQRDQPHPAFFFGKGKLSQIKEIIHKHSISFLITDGQLSPKQAQNLEKSLHKPVLDRTQLILEIFGRNARTREAKLQIELAQSEYLLPRLLGMWKHLDRERGALEFQEELVKNKLRKTDKFYVAKLLISRKISNVWIVNGITKKAPEFMPTSQSSWLYQRRKINDHECIDQLRFARWK